nr:transporter substrate-binding domain-containing protein [Neptunicella marina]
MAVEDSWPPYAKKDGTGLSVSIVKQALALSGSNVDFVVVPYARALRMAEIGEVDGAFNVTKQDSTTSKFIFGQQPLLKARASYFYAADSHMDYLNPGQIASGSVIGLIIGYEYGDAYEDNRARFDEVRVSNQRQIIRLLLDHKVDLAIMFDEVAAFTIREMGLADNAVRKGQLNHVSDIFVAFSKQAKDVQQKIDLLDKGLLQLKQTHQ